MEDMLYITSEPLLDKEGKPYLHFYFSNEAGKYVREITKEERDSIESQFKERILEYFRMPFDQIQKS